MSLLCVVGEWRGKRDVGGVGGLHVVAIGGFYAGAVGDGADVLAVRGVGGTDVVSGCAGVGNGYVWGMVGRDNHIMWIR